MFERITVENYEQFKQNDPYFDKNLKVLNYLRLMDVIVFNKGTGDIVGLYTTEKKIMSDELSESERNKVDELLKI